MESFVLTPVTVKGDRVVPLSDPPLTVGWDELVTLVGGSKTTQSLLTLRRLRPRDFVGVRRSASAETNFLVSTPSGKRSIKWVLDKQPNFASTVVRMYRVEAVNYDVAMREAV